MRGQPRDLSPPGTSGAPDALGQPDVFGSLDVFGSPGVLGRRGGPADQDNLARADVLERAPGRWSPSRLGRPPRWLLAVIAVLVLAGGVTAAVAGGLRHNPGRPDRPGVQAAVSTAPRTACGYVIAPVTGTAVASSSYKRVKGVGCAPPRTGRAGPGGSRPGSSIICVGLQVQAEHPATQFGIRHRCFPGLT